MGSKCVKCGGFLRKGTITESLSVGGVSFVAEMPAQLCSACGESYVAGHALGQMERSVAAELARRGCRTPDAFRFMRKAIGLKAAELAELLDVSPETVSRWENGGLPVEPRAFALLGGVVVERVEGRGEGTLERLRALKVPIRAAEPVRVKVA